MKARAKHYLMVISIIVCSLTLNAQPPDPPSDPSAGGGPIGGGAPLGSGTGVVLLMLSVYGAAKWRACLRNTDETDQEIKA